MMRPPSGIGGTGRQHDFSALRTLLGLAAVGLFVGGLGWLLLPVDITAQLLPDALELALSQRFGIGLAMEFASLLLFSALAWLDLRSDPYG